MTDTIPPTPDGLRKKKGQTRIAHISDLHFSSGTNYEEDDVWKALRLDLQTSGADLLVVTGDLIDSSVGDNIEEQGIRNAFSNTKKFLLSLCKEDVLNINPETRLAVVPGNHDYRVKGVFSPHSKYGFLERAKQRFISAHKDLFFEHFGTYFEPRFHTDLHCCVFTFDSNTADFGLNLASGRITNGNLVDFLAKCNEWSRKNDDKWDTCAKIALVHHHPMPIADTELKGKFIESETYHLLKNSGLFMTEMVNQGIDLILHGHKHYPAFSQAKFPKHDDTSQIISVIAAGSASEHGEPYSSYNLITIFDNGRISLERRIRKTSNYTGGERHRELLPYDQTRRVLFDRLAKRTKFRVEKCTRIDSIKSGSGDDEITRHYRGMRTTSGEPEPYVDYHFVSSSGFVSKPSFESSTHQISWQPYKDRPGQWQTTFDPPISDGSLDFTYKVNILNAMHFNQQDRLDATDNKERDESSYLEIVEAYDLFVFKVMFPGSFSPVRPTVHVLDLAKQRDQREEEYASSRFSSFADDKTAVLIMDHPLPGYTYKIVWGLPETEDEERNLSDPDRLLRSDIQEKLLGLRSTENKSILQGLLANLKTTVNEATANSKPIGARDLEVILHVHDCDSKGLVCVGALAAPDVHTRLGSHVFKVGVSTIGQAYRRREQMGWVRGRNRGNDDGFLDFDPGPVAHSCILSFPLLYPLNTGAKIGVVTLASRSNTAPMIRLLARNRPLEDEAAFRLLAAKLVKWYAHDVMAALGLQPISIPKPPEMEGEE